MTQNLTPNIAPTDLTMTLLMTPDMANFSGNVHGGTILKLLDPKATRSSRLCLRQSLCWRLCGDFVGGSSDLQRADLCW